MHVKGLDALDPEAPKSRRRHRRRDIVDLDPPIEMYATMD